MYPNHVERLIIDGVLDTADYYCGSWLKNLQDSNKIITAHCENCYSSDLDQYTLYTGTSRKDIEVRLERIMLKSKTNLMAVPEDAIRGPEIVTFGDMLLQMLNPMLNTH